MMRSKPPSRWKGESPPSPVSIQQPAFAAPRDSARTAGSEIAPKLIPLMLTTDLARKGFSQKSAPIASGGVGRRASSSTGEGWVTNRMEPGSVGLFGDPKPITPPSAVARRGTQPRGGPLEGDAERAFIKQYGRE